MRSRVLLFFPITAAMLFVLLFAGQVLAQGRGNGDGEGGGSGGEDPLPPSYELIDLLGLPGPSLQSSGHIILDRGTDGSIIVAGNSHQYVVTGLPARPLPAAWLIDAEGILRADDPITYGLPDWATEVDISGINHNGIAVGSTIGAKYPDENENWIFPPWAYIPGQGFEILPLPTGATGGGHVRAFNSMGTILGYYEIVDLSAPQKVRGFAALWQVQANGTISDPVDIVDSTSFPGFSPLDINDFGVMAGHSGTGFPAIAWFDGPSLEVVSLDSYPEFFGSSWILVGIRFIAAADWQDRL